MSRGHKKTLGQRLGLLTGGALIVGGVLGWAWSLFQAPGQAASPPVEIPRPPEIPQPPQDDTAQLSTTESQVLTAAAEHESLAPEPPTWASPADEPEVDEPDAPVPASEAAPAAVPDAVKAIRAAAAAARERLETPVRALPDATAPAADSADPGK